MVFVLNLHLWWEASYIVRPDEVGLSHQAEMYGPMALRPVGPVPNGVPVLPLTRDVTISMRDLSHQGNYSGPLFPMWHHLA